MIHTADMGSIFIVVNKLRIVIFSGNIALSIYIKLDGSRFTEYMSST